MGFEVLVCTQSECGVTHFHTGLRNALRSWQHLLPSQQASWCMWMFLISHTWWCKVVSISMEHSRKYYLEDYL